MKQLLSTSGSVAFSPVTTMALQNQEDLPPTPQGTVTDILTKGGLRPDSPLVMDIGEVVIDEPIVSNDTPSLSNQQDVNQNFENGTATPMDSYVSNDDVGSPEASNDTSHPLPATCDTDKVYDPCAATAPVDPCASDVSRPTLDDTASQPRQDAEHIDQSADVPTSMCNSTRAGNDIEVPVSDDTPNSPMQQDAEDIHVSQAVPVTPMR